MTPLQFIASLVASLAWPLTVLVAILLVRGPVVGALPKLKRIKYSDLEMDFEREVDKVRVEANVLTAKQSFAPEPIPDRLIELAKLSPKTSVYEAVKEVDRELARLANRYAISPIQGNEDSILRKAFSAEPDVGEKMWKLYERVQGVIRRFHEESSSDTSFALGLIDVIIDVRNLLQRV